MSVTVNGVFEGGGVRGIALAGGAAAALEYGFAFGHVVGTSAGGLVASLVAVGCGPDEIADPVSLVDSIRYGSERPILATVARDRVGATKGPDPGPSCRSRLAVPLRRPRRGGRRALAGGPARR